MQHTIEFVEAAEIYQNTMQELGYLPSNPSERSSELINGVWYLRNSNGFLAKVGTKSRAVINPPSQM